MEKKSQNFRREYLIFRNTQIMLSVLKIINVIGTVDTVYSYNTKNRNEYAYIIIGEKLLKIKIENL